MTRYIPDKYRSQVIKRAQNLCEYCLIHEDDAFYSFEIDHIISLKHGGLTEIDNLAYACLYCNRYKGSDVGSVLLPELEFVRFYHPRNDNWYDHFSLQRYQIVPLSKIGEATIKILEINHINRLIERQILIEMGRYPGL